MRRPSASRTSTAVAVVAAIVAVAAVMGFPGLSIGQTTGIHGGSPSDVFMLREDQGCAPDGVPADGVGIMPLQLELEEPSHLLVYFSFGWHALDTREQGEVQPLLDGSGEGFEWRFTGNGTAGTISGTVMSSFPNVDAGTHTVDVFAAVGLPVEGAEQRGSLFAGLSDCVLTVMVLPAE